MKYMEKTNQRKMEKELQKALAIAYVTPFCLENNLSLEKLQLQRCILSCNECAFAQPSGVKPNGLVNDALRTLLLYKVRYSKTKGMKGL